MENDVSGETETAVWYRTGTFSSLARTHTHILTHSYTHTYSLTAVSSPTVLWLVSNCWWFINRLGWRWNFTFPSTWGFVSQPVCPLNSFSRGFDTEWSLMQTDVFYQPSRAKEIDNLSWGMVVPLRYKIWNATTQDTSFLQTECLMTTSALVWEKRKSWL